MTTDSARSEDRSDADLIASVRAGRIEEYGVLYERHVAAATRLARQLGSPADADDVVSQAFASVLDALRDGKGPDSAFRAYLLTTVRNTAYSRARTAKRTQPAEDITELTSPAAQTALTTDFADPALAELERSLAAKAYFRLPERWQAVLWYTVIEQLPPAEVAPLLGLSPNAVSALSYRAREGLRQEYLQAHLAETSAQRCRATATKLGAWTRDGLSLRERAQVEQHLDNCARCRALADELADINAALRGVVAFLVLGGATFGYLAAASGAAPASAVTTTAATAATLEPRPRQFLGVAVSGVALATAVAVALTAGGVGSAPVAHRPVEQQQPPADQPGTSAPDTSTPSTKQSPHSSLPPLPVPRPDAGSYQPPEALGPTVAPPYEVGEPPFPPPAAAPAPENGDDSDQDDDQGSGGDGEEPGEDDEHAPAGSPPRPHLTASGPDNGVDLTAEQRTAELDITVRNEGNATAERATVELDLPEGVSAIDPAEPESATTAESGPAAGTGTETGAAGTSRMMSESATSDGVVDCPAGEGTITCDVPFSLAPDEASVVRFTLAVSETAASGEAVGTVAVADSDPAHFAVPITVKLDKADLDVVATGRHLFVKLRNDGLRAGDATLRLDAPTRFHLDRRLHCDAVRDDAAVRDAAVRDDDASGSLRCVSHHELAPGKAGRLWTRVPHSHDVPVTITGTVGDDTATETVHLASLLPDHPHDHPDVASSTEDATKEHADDAPEAEDSDSDAEGDESMGEDETGQDDIVSNTGHSAATTADAIPTTSATTPDHPSSQLDSIVRSGPSRRAGRHSRSCRSA